MFNNKFMMFRIFVIAAFSVAICSAGLQRKPVIVVSEQQAQDSQHYEEVASSGYGGEYEGSAVDEGKESSGAELTSLAHTSAVQAKNAVRSQHTAGSQAAFGIKSTLAGAAQGAAQTAQAALVGKQAIVYGLKRQVGQAESMLQAEIAQYHQTQHAAEIAQQAAQQARSQVAALSAIIASAQSGGQLSEKAAAETSNVAAAQQSMINEAKQRLSALIHQLQNAIGELGQTESAYFKAAQAAQTAQSNAAAAGAAVVAASAKSEESSNESHYSSGQQEHYSSEQSHYQH